MRFYSFYILFLILLSFSLSATGKRDENIKDSRTIFNEALVAYEQNEYEKAEELLGVIDDELSGNIEEQKMMLSANNSYRLSIKSMSENGNVDNALMQINKSIGFYKRILDKSYNEIAAHNMELALMEKEKLNKINEDQQNNEKENQDQQDQLDDLRKRQENLASDDQKGTEEHKAEQEDLQNKTKELNREMSKGNDKFQNNMDKAVEKQEEAIEEINKQNFENAQVLQNEAAQHLKDASESLSGEESQETPSENNQSEQNESDQIAKSLIENENNREPTSEITGSGFNVDRNW